MSLPKHVLVVADGTLESPELLSAIEEQAQSRPLRVFLLVPTPPADRAAVWSQLDIVVRRLGSARIEAIGIIGNSVAMDAVREVWNPAMYDEVIVSSPPAAFCRWMRIGLPQRIGALTGVSVRHIVASTPPKQPAAHGVRRWSADGLLRP